MKTDTPAQTPETDQIATSPCEKWRTVRKYIAQPRKGDLWTVIDVGEFALDFITPPLVTKEQHIEMAELAASAPNLLRQRDELLGALKYARRMMKPDSDLAFVEAAIARAEKGGAS